MDGWGHSKAPLPRCRRLGRPSFRFPFRGAGLSSGAGVWPVAASFASATSLRSVAPSKGSRSRGAARRCDATGADELEQTVLIFAHTPTRGRRCSRAGLDWSIATS